MTNELEKVVSFEYRKKRSLGSSMEGTTDVPIYGSESTGTELRSDISFV